MACQAAQAQDVRLLTEDYPPFNFATPNGGVDGISVRVVNELLAATGIQATIVALPWSRAYAAAQADRDTCVFSTTRTAERESLFQWVGPLVSNDWYAFALPDHGLEVESLDDLRGLRVGGYRDDAVAVYVESQGIAVDPAPNDRLNARKLAAGRIDVWVSGEFLAPYYAQQEGIGSLEPLFRFKSTEMAIACHPEFDSDRIERLQEALDGLRASGRYDEILAEFL
ncbi:MAG: substrate-binding periplasmic protein [Thioalkalivibrionaceae bacterium]